MSVPSAECRLSTTTYRHHLAGRDLSIESRIENTALSDDFDVACNLPPVTPEKGKRQITKKNRASAILAGTALVAASGVMLRSR